jgi:ABC-type sugar transport system ATPase subunit
MSAVAVPSSAEAPTLAVRSIGKRFGGQVALMDVTLDVRAGEVHAIVGENGAGKSTLIKMLAGIYGPDEGEIFVRGERATIETPRDARALGLGFLHQQLHLVGERSVRENVFLTSEYPRRLGSIDWTRVDSHCARLMKMVGLGDVDPRLELGRLNLAQQQLVALARTLQDEPQIIVLDEPTSALGEEDTQHLLEVVRNRRAEGATVIFVSHRVDEVLSIADSVTILRDGKLIETRERTSLSRRLLVELLGGHASRDDDGEEEIPRLVRRRTAGRRNALTVQNLTGPGLDFPATLEIAPNEVLGLAGLVGSGRSTLAAMIAGAARVASGLIAVDGAPVTIRTRQDAFASGIVLVPSDRADALVLNFDIPENITLGHAERYAWRRVVLRKRQQRRRALELAEALNIKGAKGDSTVRYMSGGNQQKLLLARAIDRRPRVLLLDEPTAGVDIATKEYIYSLVRELAREGISVLFISSELEELPRVCDRIAVFSRGRILDELSGATDRATIVERLFRETDRAGSD